MLLVVVITNSIVEEELSGPGVDSPPSSIGDRVHCVRTACMAFP